MYKVALCEDEDVFSVAQERICREILDELDVEYHIDVFKRSADFLAALGQERTYDLVLLDILMDGVNGVELAKSIRRTDAEADIIFITSSSEHMLAGYDVHALHYLMKPVDKDKLEQLIHSAYKNRFQKSYYVFKSGAAYQRVALRDIISLETVGRRVEITLPDRSLFYSGKLADLLEQLPKDRFIRCHQAYGLNLGNVRELARFEAITTNGRKIPISRKYQKDVQQAFLRAMQAGET